MYKFYKTIYYIKSLSQSKSLKSIQYPDIIVNSKFLGLFYKPLTFNFTNHQVYDLELEHKSSQTLSGGIYMFS